MNKPIVKVQVCCTGRAVLSIGERHAVLSPDQVRDLAHLLNRALALQERPPDEHVH